MGNGYLRSLIVVGATSMIRYARENKVPYFGICLGMQTMVIKYARNVCGLERADSSEFIAASHNDCAAHHR